jgi:hypothetical protein
MVTRQPQFPMSFTDVFVCRVPVDRLPIWPAGVASKRHNRIGPQFQTIHQANEPLGLIANDIYESAAIAGIQPRVFNQ